MNTIDFIRHHTRLILEKDEKSDNAPAQPRGGGDYKGKYSKSVRVGRMSGEAKRALGLAGSNPRQLLNNLGINKYETKGGDALSEVLDFIDTARRTNTLLGAAFEKPTKESNHIDIPVFLLGGKVAAIKQTQAPRYVKALLLSGHLLGLIDFDIEKNSVGLRSVESEEDDESSSGDKQYFVRVTLK